MITKTFRKGTFANLDVLDIELEIEQEKKVIKRPPVSLEKALSRMTGSSCSMSARNKNKKRSSKGIWPQISPEKAPPAA